MFVQVAGRPHTSLTGIIISEYLRRPTSHVLPLLFFFHHPIFPRYRADTFTIARFTLYYEEKRLLRQYHMTRMSNVALATLIRHYWYARPRRIPE